ncbi:MAG: hypothetical protein ACJAZ9_001065 [Neolewinella sp.]|jgi:hypothetical protein
MHGGPNPGLVRIYDGKEDLITVFIESEGSSNAELDGG